MLSGIFYKIVSKEIIADSIQVTIELNPEHEIFKGHFPGMPVVPGACMVQILKEITEGELNQKLRLEKADNIKFLAVINPRIVRTIIYNISIKFNNSIEVSAELSNNVISYFKFKGNFKLSA
jgi:3-hydroxyacyl-[acyl-carrier-protein] dehydratase